MKESHVSAVSGGLSIFGVMRSQNEKSHFLRNLCLKIRYESGGYGANVYFG
jgi:hypothetical protein